MDVAASPSGSTQPTKLCALCPTKTPSKYTCPRCLTSTCSLACSKLHKQTTGCSGVRDKAVYIPLNKYSWGSMMDDYCFLEDVGRKVSEWGREIVRGGFEMNVSGRGRGGRGRGRGRGGAQIGRGRGARGFIKGRDRGGRGRGGKGKREILKAQLEARDIEVELLSSGMERRQLNQSVWNQKTQAALLTIQFKFYPSTEAQSTSGAAQPFTLLTHRNSLSIPLLTLVQKHIQDRLNKKPTTENDTPTFPVWIPPLILPPPEDPENFTTPTFVIPAPSDPVLLARSAVLVSASAPRQTSDVPNGASAKPRVYYSLDPYEPLSKSLRGTQFIEFPMIEVWEDFRGVVIDKKTGSIRCMSGEVGPQKKRRRLNPEEGWKTISGLVGEYGSDDENNDEEGEVEPGKSGLVGYVESEGEEEDDRMAMEQDNVVDEEIEAEDEDEEGEDVDFDPAVLLELMQRAKQEGKWMEEEDDDDSDDLSDQERRAGK